MAGKRAVEVAYPSTWPVSKTDTQLRRIAKNTEGVEQDSGTGYGIRELKFLFPSPVRTSEFQKAVRGYFGVKKLTDVQMRVTHYR